jgi:hypothetical protein
LDILGSCTGDVDHLEAAGRIAEEVANAEGIVRAYLNLASVHTVGGRQREAVDIGRRGLAAARELGLERAIGVALAANLAEGMFVLGD